MNQCPGLEQLQRLLAEELPLPERATLEVHVERCLHCQQTLEQLVADPQMPSFARSARIELIEG